jgi:hypothetical protein
VIDNISYDYSKEDQETIDQALVAQKALVGSIITAYKESGIDTPPIDYPNIGYIMGAVCRYAHVSDYRDVDTDKYQNLAELCGLLNQYGQKANLAMTLQKRWVDASFRLDAINENIKNPSQENSGIDIGINKWNIGWEHIPSSADLLTSLKTGSFTINMSMSNFDEGTTELHLHGNSVGRVNLGFILGVSIEDESSYDLSKLARSGARMDVDITFSGVTPVACVPQPLSANNKMGWYAPNILAEATQKSGKDTTGYKLNGSEFSADVIFGQNGTLRRVKTLVIAQQPTIKLSMKNFDESKTTTAFKKENNVSFKLFGLFEIGGRNSGYSTDYKENASNQSQSVTFVPPLLAAFVLGCVVESY